MIVLLSCGGQNSFVPSTPTNTRTLPPTSTATLTPTPIPTDTPTPVPTPVGGSGKLILGAARQESPSSDQTSRIYLYDVSAHKATLLLEGFFLLGKATPDGSKMFLYRYTEGQEFGEFYIADVNDPRPILLHDRVYSTNSIVWLPATDWIAFVASVNNKNQVFVIHPDGTGLMQVTESNIGAGEVLPAFDGGIYWEEAQSRDSGHYSYGYRWTKIDGSETKQLDWIRSAISLDGKNVAYISIDRMFQGISEFVISNLDGSNSTTISIETLEPPKTELSRFWDLSWLPNNHGVLAEVSWCDSGTTCTNKYFIFSRDGTILRELPETIIQETILFESRLFGDWSPDTRLYGYPRFDKFESGNFQTTPMIFDLEAMETKSLEIKLNDGFKITKIYWLSSGK